jgi:hypothetical protein
MIIEILQCIKNNDNDKIDLKSLFFLEGKVEKYLTLQLQFVSRSHPSRYIHRL